MKREDLRAGMFVKGISRRGMVIAAPQNRTFPDFVPVHWAIRDEWEFSDTSPDVLTVISKSEFSDHELSILIPGIWIDGELYDKNRVRKLLGKD